MVKSILLFSGGIDSTLTYLYLIKEKGYKPENIVLQYFTGLSQYSEKEIINISETVKQYKEWGLNSTFKHCQDLSFLKNYEESNSFVPYRNLLMFVYSHLCYYSLSKEYNIEILTAGMKDDRVSDKDENFYRIMEELGQTCNKDINKPKFYSPVIHLTKIELLQMAKENNWIPNFEDFMINHTFSCYSDGEECLQCSACFRKSVALHSVGIERTFNNDKLVEKYLEDIKSKKLDDIRLFYTKDYIEKILKNKAVPKTV